MFVSIGLATLALSSPPGLIAHEWGTLPAVAGADGAVLDWRPLAGPSELPRFVHQVGDGYGDRNQARNPGAEHGLCVVRILVVQPLRGEPRLAPLGDPLHKELQIRAGRRDRVDYDPAVRTERPHPFGYDRVIVEVQTEIRSKFLSYLTAPASPSATPMSAAALARSQAKISASARFSTPRASSGR